MPSFYKTAVAEIILKKISILPAMVDGGNEKAHWLDKKVGGKLLGIPKLILKPYRNRSNDERYPQRCMSTNPADIHLTLSQLLYSRNLTTLPNDEF